MEFKQFLKHAHSPPWWSAHSWYCIQAEEYSPFFVSSLFASLVKHAVFAAKPTLLLYEDQGRTFFFEELNQTFLGQKMVYWLGDLTALWNEQKSKHIVSFLSQYSGPHQLIFFVKNDVTVSKDASRCVELPKALDEKMVHELLEFFHPESLARKMTMLTPLLKKHRVLPLEAALRLCDYFEVAGMRAGADFEHIVSYLLDTDGSLFELAHLFFAKKEKEFFAHWRRMHNNYPLIFWITFWSEQLWRAHYVVFFLQQGNFAHAKVMSVRLPFAFMKSLWKNFSLAELAAAYSFLYKADYAAKTGSDFCSMDLFFSNYFSGKSVR